MALDLSTDRKNLRDPATRTPKSDATDPSYEHLTPLPVDLAPMEGVTGIATRLWFHLVGSVSAMSTPFLRATASFPHQRLPADFAPEWYSWNGSSQTETRPPYRLMPQIMASQAEHFLRAARYVPSHSPVELNCGCPAPHSFGGGAGSALLQSPSSWDEMLTRIIDQLGPGRLAVKMRLGIGDAEEEFPRLFAIVAEKPLYRLTIHGRTRQDRYRGYSRWDLVDWASRQTDTPVFASGDVVDATSFQRLTERAPRIAGVLVGRGALRNPWIFSNLVQKPVTSGQLFAPPPHAPRENVEPEELVRALQCFYALERSTVVASHVLNQTRLRDFLNELCQQIFEAARNPRPINRWDSALVRLESLEKKWFWKQTDPETSPSVSSSFQPPSLQSCSSELTGKLERLLTGRLKMLWNYLRSSLPAEFQKPELLREKTAQSFWQALNHTIDRWQAHSQMGKIPLSYKQDLDWIYAGGGKPPAPQGRDDPSEGSPP